MTLPERIAQREAEVREWVRTGFIPFPDIPNQDRPDDGYVREFYLWRDKLCVRIRPKPDFQTPVIF